MCQISGEDQAIDSFFEENHRYLSTDHRQCRSDLRADEAAPDHNEVSFLFRHFAQALVVLQIAEINDIPIPKR